MLARLLLTWFLFVFAGIAAAQQTCSLSITAAGVRNDTGRVGFMVFHSEDGWPKDFEKAFRRHGLPAQAGDIEWTFHDLPQGRYGVIVVHDEDEDLRLDRNAIGFPKEGWGMSNNPAPKLSSPSFSKAAFALDCPSRIAIELRY